MKIRHPDTYRANRRRTTIHAKKILRHEALKALRKQRVPNLKELLNQAMKAINQ